MPGYLIKEAIFLNPIVIGGTNSPSDSSERTEGGEETENYGKNEVITPLRSLHRELMKEFYTGSMFASSPERSTAARGHRHPSHDGLNASVR